MFEYDGMKFKIIHNTYGSFKETHIQADNKSIGFYCLKGHMTEKDAKTYLDGYFTGFNKAISEMREPKNPKAIYFEKENQNG